MASIICRYKDGTDTICYSTSRLNDIKVNGTSIGLTTTYNVNSTDVVEFDVNYYSGTASYGENLFLNNQNLVSIELGDGITYVGTQMCAYCTSLQELKVGSSVINFFDWAFKNCTSLTTIDFTEATSLLAIGQQAFQNCTSLATIDFPDTLNNIKPQAFQNCTSLTSISFGGDIVKLFDYAFSGCTSLNRIVITAVTPPTLGLEAFNDVQYGGTLYYPTGSDYSAWLNPDTIYSLGSQGWNGVETDDFEDLDRLKLVCKYNKGSLIFNPSYASSFIDVKINGVSVGDLQQYHYTTSEDDIVEFSLRGTSIGYRDFWSCVGLVDIKIDEGVTAIGEGVFYGCTSLPLITIPSTVTDINYIAFGACSSLEAVYAKGQTCNIHPQTFKDVRRNGTLYYPNGADYSQWLSTDSNYLGYYGWNGVGVDSDFELKIYRFNIAVESLDIPQEGTVEQVEYTSLNIDEISISAPNWINVVQYSTYFELTIAANTGVERTGTITFTANPNSDNPIVDSIEVSQDAYTEPDDPDNPDDPDAPSVGSDTRTIVFEASGGTQPIDFTWSNVSYNDISTKAEAADSWIELDYEGLISPSPIITQYLVTAGVNTGEPRTTYFTFTGSTSSGEIKTETITIYQKNNEGELPNDSDMSTGCYINLDNYEYTFPATGGTYSVMGYFGFPGTNGMKTRVSSGAVYPILWCTTELLGGGVEDDGTEGNEIWKITMSENTGAAREANITFSYTNYYGESTSVVFTARQEAAENSGDEDTTAKVDAFTTTAKVKADGTPEMTSFTSIQCGYNEVTILSPVVNGDWITLGAGSSVSGTFIGYDEVRQYPISFAANEGDARTGTITFSGTDASGNTLTSICYITQATAGGGGDDEDPEIPVAGDDYVGPIWKDIEYNFGGAEMVEYGIYSTLKRSVGNSLVDVDTLLFAGRSYRRPSNGENTIYVNKICQSYMDAPLLSEEYVSTGVGYKVFKLKSGDGTTTYRTYRFVNDWSYSDDFRTGLLSRPILNDNTKVFRNQWLPFTVFGANDTVSIPYGIQYGGKQDEYGVTIPDWNSIVSITNGVVTEMFPYSGRKDGAVSYTINGITYPIVDECVQYVLYYVNPWGGYDWFPIRGKVVERDLMTAYTYMQNYNNQTMEFGKKKYLADIRKQFTLHTQWMSEEESSRMWYLLQSNTVYLHNLVEDKIYPAVITNTEQEHKKRLRGQRISYQIDVELSQTRQRI